MTREEAIECLNYQNEKFFGGQSEALDMAISALSENKGEWIPCSERLPEQFKEVIVTDIETSDTYLSRYVGNGYWECDNGLFKNRIIAWQPKPKPYKEEKRR